MTHRASVKQVDLGPNDVHVWWRGTGVPGNSALDEAVALLSPGERERCGRFVFERDRRTFAIAHALLRTSLSRYADVAPAVWRFEEAPGGKPYLAPGAAVADLAFNLTHTDGLVACAIGRNRRIGVDVEGVDRTVDDSVASRFFSEAERADLERLPAGRVRSTRFFELWTLKEAYVKATGAGLAHPLNTIVFTPAGADGAIGFEAPADVDSARWRFALFRPTDRHIVAVAGEGEPQEPLAITIHLAR